MAARVPADVHPAQEHPLFAVQLGAVRSVVVVPVMQRQRTRLVLRNAPAELGLDRAVVLLVDDVVHRVTVDQQVLLERRRGRSFINCYKIATSCCTVKPSWFDIPQIEI